jgi:hypothetical protein
VLHEAFAEVIPEREHRKLLFNPSRKSNLRTAKQVADLYLIQVANRSWRRILEASEFSDRSAALSS